MVKTPGGLSNRILVTIDEPVVCVVVIDLVAHPAQLEFGNDECQTLLWPFSRLHETPVLARVPGFVRRAALQGDEGGDQR